MEWEVPTIICFPFTPHSIPSQYLPFHPLPFHPSLAGGIRLQTSVSSATTTFEIVSGLTLSPHHSTTSPNDEFAPSDDERCIFNKSE